MPTQDARSPWELPPEMADRFRTTDMSIAERRASDQRHFAALKDAARERITVQSLQRTLTASLGDQVRHVDAAPLEQGRRRRA